MNPPTRPSIVRRSISTHPIVATSTLGGDLPDPLASSSRNFSREHNLGSNMENIKPEASDWDPSVTRLQVELAECIETKTVTTTTTTKRSYPPLLVGPPQCPQGRDSKEYPLARKPTPKGLTNFSYMVGNEMITFRQEDTECRTTEQSKSSTARKNPQSMQRRSTPKLKFETPTVVKATRRLSRDEELTEDDSLRHGSKSQSPDSSSSFAGRDKSAFSVQKQRRGPRGSHSQRLRLEAPAIISSAAATLSTPDPDSAASTHKNKTTLSFVTSASSLGSPSFEDAPSPSITAAQASFHGAVATPPITDADLEPFGSFVALNTTGFSSRSSLNGSVIRAASLPSPSLSPTLAAANLHNAQYPSEDEADIEDSVESQESGNTLQLFREGLGIENLRSRHSESSSTHTVMDTRSMLDTFDSMPTEMKTFMMYQFLRRCPRKTLHTVADVVNPALKCDFLEELPPELSLHILSFLRRKDLCRAAQVSKRWRNIIDSNESGWKELLDRDGLVVPAGEVEKAIIQGWGWQDPYDTENYERDLSKRRGSASGETIGGRFIKESTQTFRPSMKRKRTLGNMGLDRSKRRAMSQEGAEKLGLDQKSSGPAATKDQKSDGPNAAATAAALAVPDPHLGLPSLRKLHLFKSLYRRHYLIQQNWMSGKFPAHHMAFPAHPRHVITCLQFDDDKILTGSDDTYIHVYDTKTGKLRKRLEGHEGGVWALQYEGNVLVSGSTDRSVRVWDIEKGLCTQVFQGHTSTVRCLQILMPVKTGKTSKGQSVMVPEKPLIITGSRDSQLRVWRLPEPGAKRYIQTGPPQSDTDCPYFVRVLQGHTHSVRAIAAQEDTLISGSYDFSVRVWKISTGETMHQLRGHGAKVYSVVLDYARKRCISGSMDNTVKIWSLETGNCLYTLEGHSSLVGLLDLKDDRLVSAAADSTLRIWDPAEGTCKATLTAHTGAITCFQHDGSKVISGSDRTLKMWNVKTGECMQDLLTELSGVWQVKFDGRRCVAAVQRESLTYIEVLDFGASRDGIPISECGRRILQSPSDVDRVTEDDDFAG